MGSVGSVKRGRRLSQGRVGTFVRFYYLIYPCLPIGSLRFSYKIHSLDCSINKDAE